MVNEDMLSGLAISCDLNGRPSMINRLPFCTSDTTILHDGPQLSQRKRNAHSTNQNIHSSNK